MWLIKTIIVLKIVNKIYHSVLSNSFCCKQYKWIINTLPCFSTTSSEPWKQSNHGSVERSQFTYSGSSSYNLFTIRAQRREHRCFTVRDDRILLIVVSGSALYASHSPSLGSRCFDDRYCRHLVSSRFIL